jgi:hypothetical protein
MSRERIGQEILQLLSGPKIPLTDGKTARPLSANFDAKTIQDDDLERKRKRDQEFKDWNRSLRMVFRTEHERQTWVQKLVNEEMLPPYYEDLLRKSLQRLHEVLLRIPVGKRPNFVIFPATSAPILAHAARPILAKLGIEVKSFAFPTTRRETWPGEFEEEDFLSEEVAQGGAPSETARDRLLTPPSARMLFGVSFSTPQAKRMYNDYQARRDVIQEYSQKQQSIPTDIVHAQTEYQLRQQLAAWHDQTGLPIDQCRPLIIDDYVDVETTVREVTRGLQRGGVDARNVTAFSFLGYDMPKDGVTRDLFGRERVHVGQAVYIEKGFPFNALPGNLPPMSGTYKRDFHRDETSSPYIIEELVDEPVQMSVSSALSPNSRTNYNALKQGLRRKLRQVGEEVAKTVK